MKILSITTGIAVMGLGSGLVMAGEVAVSCPQRIYTSQQLRSDVPAGWETSDGTQKTPGKEWLQSEHRLLGASLFEGAANAMSAPDNAARNKGDLQIFRWTLAQSDDVYLHCAYSRTTVELVIKLKPDLKVCEQTSSKSSVVVEVTCSR
jgi:hypothetical protein